MNDARAESDAAVTSAPNGLVTLTEVNKHFGDLHVLKDINLSIGKGEVVVVIGPSGSGKSTLCRAINRLEPIDSGTITLDGKPLAGISTVADGPGIGGHWRIALNNVEIAPGAHTIQVLAVGVEGTRLMIVAHRSAGAPREDLPELRAILDSIRIEP